MSGKQSSSATSRSASIESTEPDIWCISRERRGPGQQGDRSIGQVARDFDLTETAVREWVRQAERDAGTRGDGGLTSQERQELAVLRRENRRLREDVEILKRATAFFVKETR
jgi:transposase